MKKEDIIDALNLLDEEIIEETDRIRRSVPLRKKRTWWKWMTAAAIFCLVIWGSTQIPKPKIVKEKGELIGQQWQQGFEAYDYFAHYDDPQTEAVSSVNAWHSWAHDPLGTNNRSFTEKQEAMEQEEVIPIMEEYEFGGTAYYDEEDNSFRCLKFTWYSEDGYLRVLAGPQEVHEPKDCIITEYDAKGRKIDPPKTITVRDNVQIVAEGRENQEKSISYHTEHGYYLIIGNWNNTYEEITDLFEWFWEHPIDFSQVTIEKGDYFTIADWREYPKAFAEYVPDYETYGYRMYAGDVLLKNGEIYGFSGAFTCGNDIGYTWRVYTQPRYVTVTDEFMPLSELTKEWLQSQVGKYDSLYIGFEQDELFFELVVDPLENQIDIIWQIISDWRESL